MAWGALVGSHVAPEVDQAAVLQGGPELVQRNRVAKEVAVGALAEIGRPHRDVAEAEGVDLGIGETTRSAPSSCRWNDTEDGP